MWSDSWTDADGPDQYRTRPLEILPVLWRFKRLIVIVTILATGVAYGLSYLQPTQYSTELRIILADPIDAGRLHGEEESRDSVRYLNTQAALITASPVLSRVSDLAGVSLSRGEFTDRVSIETSKDVMLITITATDTTPEGSKLLADAVGEAFMDVLEQDVQESVAAAIAEVTVRRADLQTRLTELDDTIATEANSLSAALTDAFPDGPATAVGVDHTDLQILFLQLELTAEAGLMASLHAQRSAVVLGQMQLDKDAARIAYDAAVFGSGVEVLEPALLPKNPSQPSPRRNAALGGVLGLIGVLAFALWLGERHRVANDPHDATRILRAPLLGVIPNLYSVGGTTKAPTLSEPVSVAAEAYHFVASSMERCFNTQSATVVLVASANPGDGRTITALNIAVAMAQGSRKVVLVDGDNRNRGLTHWLHLNDANGLTEISEGVSVVECIRALSDSPDDLPLKVIPAGTPVNSGSRFFRTAEFGRAMTTIREQGEVIVVDSPPILAVADALALAGQTDGLILVITGGTSIRALEDLRDRLASIRTPILGYVFNRAQDGRARSGYGFRRRRSPEPSQPDHWGRPAPAASLAHDRDDQLDSPPTDE